MTDDLDHQVQEALRRRDGRSSRTLLYVCILAAVAGISGYVWLNYQSLANLVLADRASGNAAIDRDKTGVAQKDFDTLKRETAASLQSLNEAISAQQAGLKEMADQIAALSVKVEASRSAAPPVGSVMPPVEIRQQAAPAPALASAPRKRAAPKTNGPISVGGAPLPPSPRDGQ